MRSPGGADRPPDIAVVGAGAFGGWTALCLREQGASVTLLDAYGPGNSRASSGDETRQIRAGYADQDLYTRWAVQALERWQRREKDWGCRLLYRTGRLLLAPEWDERLQRTQAALDRHGVPNEVLSERELARRHPQLNPEGLGVALFEPTAAVLRARAGCAAVAEAFERQGGRLRIARALPGRQAGARLLELELCGAAPLAASDFVFACGPWLPKLFPELLARRLRTPRRDVFFFGTPAGDERFSYPCFPSYVEASGEGYYGFPSLEHRGFKVCPVGERSELDPDTDERVVSPQQLKRARDYLARRFPALREQPVLESRVCQLELSVDENFIIQRHPALENVWLVGGGSGHGYKHGPLVGEYAAARVLGAPGEPELEALFALKAQTF